MIEFFGTIFIIVLGTLFHFIYDWTKHNKLVGYFAAVNESTWEHLKLIIAPSFLWMIVEYHFYFNNINYFFARFIAVIVMIIFIPTIFYTYTHFSKKPILAIDISSFILATIIGQFVFYVLLNMNSFNIVLKHIGVIGLIIVFLRYITHTYVPDKNFLHQDPITNKYGIEGHYIEKNKK